MNHNSDPQQWFIVGKMKVWGTGAWTTQFSLTIGLVKLSPNKPEAFRLIQNAFKKLLQNFFLIEFSTTITI